MPTYEYRCEADQTFMVLSRSIEDRDKEVLCSKCNLPMIRQIQASPIHFKGTGFYKTGG